MPQLSIYYACGRVGVLGRTALKRAQVDRLMSAGDYRDAIRTLSDIGFAAPDSLDYQAATDQHVLKACELLKAVTPEPKVTDCFLLRYDVHNLKILIKSRHLAQKPDFLSACGTLNVEKLRHCVADHTYALLPAELKASMENLEKKIAAHFDPMLVDTELDRAMYRQIFQNLKESQNVDKVKQYFQAKADMQNMIMLLRLKAMGKTIADFLSVAIPGGGTDPKAYADDFTENERLPKLMRRYGVKVYQATLAAIADAAKLPLLEKEADDYLYGIFKGNQYTSASLNTVIAYLLRRQREATDVRLVMAGKRNGFTPEAVGERMRELDG